MSEKEAKGKKGKAEGAQLVLGGERVMSETGGYYVAPTVFDDVAHEMSISKEEIFGPVLSVLRVKTYDEALELLNNNPFGNGTAIFTRDGGAARQFCEDAPVGMVGVNVPIPFPVRYHPCATPKHTLFRDTHMYGPEGIRFYTKTQAITTRWPDPASSSVDLGFPRND